MKKTFVSICMAVTLLSCGSVKQAVTVSDIDGEWNIVEINGAAVVPAPDQPFPTIGFSAKDGRVYGNSGCNRLIGTFNLDAKPGEIDLGALGSTRVMCPDMTVEKNVLSALSQVKKYRKMEDGNIALCGSSKRPILVLQRKTSGSSAVSADLGGRWEIVEAGGVQIPQGLEKQPFLEFNVGEMRVHGNAGCNIINGGFQLDDALVNGKASIAFSQMISTMMACPDMEIESRILKSLGEVKAFAKLEDGKVGLYNGEDALVLVLQQSADASEEVGI